MAANCKRCANNGFRCGLGILCSRPNSLSCHYTGTVFSIGVSIRVKDPRTSAERYWNRAQDVLTAIAVIMPIALKLTGVITWSWWWVALSPLWISPVLLALAITALAIQPFKQAKPWLAHEAGAQDASRDHQI